LRPDAPPDARQVTAAAFPAYLEELEWEAERAWALATWKTLLPCRKHEVAVIEYLRSRRPAYLADLSAGSTIAA
jgi:hypothetical protein